MTKTASTSASDPPPAGRRDDEHPYRYTAAVADEIERKWQAAWDRDQTFRTPNPGEEGFDPSRPRYFCLDMFPYPSGAGLHVGHPEGYTATDIVSRYMRHRGCNVLHPMGWDAFGLPAEQYAIQTGVHPAVTTRASIDNFRRQLKRFGFSYDWTREFATVDRDYYRWTQWIWLKAYGSWYDQQQDRARPIGELVRALEQGDLVVGPGREVTPADDASAHGSPRRWTDLSEDERRAVIDHHRLAYLGEQMVNWCPALGTVLANEEVIDGKSERGGHPVLRKPLRQWMFRITAYADRLLRDLEDLDWPESTRIMQGEWIGRSEGAEIDFEIVAPRGATTALRVFTTRPDTVFGATYMVVAPEHPLVREVLDDPPAGTDVDAVRRYVEAASRRAELDRLAEAKEKTGEFMGVHAVNPATKERIPVWVADYVLMGYGHGAIMAVPGQDERDWAFAKAFDLPIVRTVQPPSDFEGDGAYLGDGPAINSGFLDGLHVAEAKEKTVDWLETHGIGRRKVNYKLRDWLFSRQRYWGEPFPIVYDEQGRHHAVDESNLPVALPELDDYTPVESDDPVPLLAKATDWIHTTAGEAGVHPDDLPPDTLVTRETNTMPGWAGSCWYYLRFCDPQNEARFCDEAFERYWLSPTEENPVGGVDLYIGGAEHAVLHLLYARFWHKILYDLGEVSTPEPFRRLFHQGMITSFAFQRADGSLVALDEVEERNPGELVEKANGAPVYQIAAKMSKSLKNVVNPDDVIAEFGADTFRLYEMYMGPLQATKPWNTRDMVGLFRFLQRVWRLVLDEETGAMTLRAEPDAAIEKLLHRTIGKVGVDIERLGFNTAIAALIEFVNEANKAGGLTADQAARFAIVLSPFTPHVAEEIWSRLGNRASIAHAPWPAVDDSMLRDDEVELPVQVLGKVRSRIMAPADADAKTIERMALDDDRIRTLLEGRTVRKVIVVPGKIVNIIAN